MNKTLAWVLSFIAASATLLLVVLHMSWVSVNYLLLTGVVLLHGFYSLHTMLTEYWSGPRAGIVIGAGCILLGAGLFSLVLLTEMVTA